ncbi:MAG: hypothetical protein ABIV28_01165 [Longimicrobiales bacterium]
MRRFAVALAFVVALAPHSRAHAQNVNAFVANVASAWSRGDANAIAAFADQQGIALEVEGTHVGSISPRQAAAVLRRVFEDRETVRATAGAVKRLSGNDKRAYAEIVWERRARGTTQPERINVFIALAREGDVWRITEIRLIP